MVSKRVSPTNKDLTPRQIELKINTLTNEVNYYNIEPKKSNNNGVCMLYNIISQKSPRPKESPRPLEKKLESFTFFHQKFMGSMKRERKKLVIEVSESERKSVGNSENKESKILEEDLQHEKQCENKVSFIESEMKIESFSDEDSFINRQITTSPNKSVSEEILDDGEFASKNYPLFHMF
jgi:hypothetical protein